MQNAEFTIYFNEKRFHHRRSWGNFKNSRDTHKEHNAVKSVFSEYLGGRYDSSNSLKNCLTRLFSNIPWKMYEDTIFRSVQIVYTVDSR